MRVPGGRKVAERCGGAIGLDQPQTMHLVGDEQPSVGERDAVLRARERAIGGEDHGGVARTSLGLDHLGINWEAHGHPPGPFLTPHFDFHFYNVTRQRLAGLDCADVSKPAVLPRGFALPDIDVPGLGTLHGLCVPTMGMHAMPVDDMNADGPFGATMVIGYYEGKPIFIEPMVSRERLLQRTSFALDVPAIDVPKGVRYPRHFAAKYDAANERYDLILSGFDDR
jgi:hypothetical protein